MPSVDGKLYWGPMHANNNVICAIDIRVGGDNPLESDLLEVCLLPLNHSYRVHPDFPVFNIRMRPDYPVDLKTATLSVPRLKDEFSTSMIDSIKGVELFESWVEKLKLANHKKILPLSWGWYNILPWLKHWLGPNTFDHYIHESYRDLLVLLNFINDRNDYHGEDVPYKHPTFQQLLVRSGVKLFDRNSLSANCLAMSEIYRLLLHNR